jgi:tetratricopeptide (TPR) repeat protein
VDNRYLAGVKRTSATPQARTFVLVVLATITIAAAALSTDLGIDAIEWVAQSGPIAPSLVVVALVVVGMIATMRSHILRTAGVRPAEAKLLEDDIDGAIAAAQAALANAIPMQRHNALIVLGACAERRGDFDDAAELFGLASASLPAPRSAQVERLADARRAFALAAAGRLDEAETALGTTAATTHAYFLRARALLLAKRGRHKELLDALSSARSLVRTTMAMRERLFVRVLAVHARAALSPSTREAGAYPVVSDPEVAAWIVRVFPKAEGLLAVALR